MGCHHHVRSCLTILSSVYDKTLRVNDAEKLWGDYVYFDDDAKMIIAHSVTTDSAAYAMPDSPGTTAVNASATQG